MSFQRTPQIGPRWSISSTLALLFGLIASLVLILAVALIYWGDIASHQQRDALQTVDEINVLRTLLEKRGEQVVQRRIGYESESMEYTRRYVRLLDEEGRTLFESPGMSEILPGGLFPEPTAERPSLDDSTWLKLDGKEYVAKSVWVTNVKDSPRRILQVALDVSAERKIFASYHRYLYAIIFVGILLSAFGGVYVARRGLRPIEEIAAVAESITAENLHERLQSRPWPRELQHVAAAFDQMLDRMEDSFARLSHCATNLAHELRTPLNNLIGEAEVLLARERDPDEYRHIIESSLEEYRRLTKIFDSLLFLARAEHGQELLERADFSVQDELVRLCDYYEPLAEESGVALSCQGDALLNADLTLFRRLIGNLVSNALKYTPAGGRIALVVSRSDDGWTEVRVTDTGCGISEAELPRIFDRFYRVDATRHQDPKGVGLGLSIARSIMTLHGGAVGVESRPGRGTTFILRFPPFLA